MNEETLFAMTITSFHPITFTSDSVHGIQQDLKIETRRVMYPQPTGVRPFQLPPDPEQRSRKFKYANISWVGQPGETWRSSYGSVGDRLWVREVWARVEPAPTILQYYGIPNAWRLKENPDLLEYWRKRVVYLADFPGKKPDECGRGSSDNEWRSPVTMPRWASRLMLEVQEVRAERLHEITAQGCYAEGVRVYEGTRLILPGEEKLSDRIYLDQFVRKWNAINGQKNPWANNPWVWVITFRRVDA